MLIIIIIELRELHERKEQSLSCTGGREQGQRSEALPAIGDSRNDVGLSLGW